MADQEPTKYAYKIIPPAGVRGRFVSRSGVLLLWPYTAHANDAEIGRLEAEIRLAESELDEGFRLRNDLVPLTPAVRRELRARIRRLRNSLLRLRGG